MTSFDIVIRRARMRGRPALANIGIRNGTIVTLEAGVDQHGAVELDAEGNLVTESFVNPHLHLDKVFTLDRAGQDTLVAYHGAGMGEAMAAIERAARVKSAYAQDWIVDNVRRALQWALHYGNTHIRAFADVDPQAGLIGVKALLQAREEFAGKIHLQVVAFPQDGVVRAPGTLDLVREAVELGADVVGGIPWIEYTEADARRHIDEMFAIAAASGWPVSMLVDDAGDPGLRTLEALAVKTLEAGWEGRVLAQHARAMALYPPPYLHKVIGLLKRARIGIVSDPHTGPLHAPVRTLRDAGIVVCLGQDDISDAYYPYGRNNMLEVAFLASHLLWMTTDVDMEALYDMITIDAARAMGVESFGLRVGGAAHVVVLTVPSVREALRAHEAPAYVISHGKLVETPRV
jgi:cytosine/creatinine deaminase